MSIFTLKARDTRPILEVQLTNPDGSVHDLTGATGFKLHIRTSRSTIITRDMVKQGLDTDGTLRYSWATTDWDSGMLPIPTSQYHSKECPMEYEVIGGSSRMTFPNDGYDILVIKGDVA
jgi:hypothetical protein